MSSVLYHFWLFLSGKSQIVNISSLREIINSFCTYSFSVSANWWFSVCYKLQQHSHLKLFYTLKEGEIWEHWLCQSLASHIICLCFVLWCVLYTVHHCTEEPSHHTRYRWGAGLGRRGLDHGSILHNILKSGSITFLSQLKQAFYVFS